MEALRGSKEEKPMGFNSMRVTRRFVFQVFLHFTIYINPGSEKKITFHSYGIFLVYNNLGGIFSSVLKISYYSSSKVLHFELASRVVNISYSLYVKSVSILTYI